MNDFRKQFVESNINYETIQFDEVAKFQIGFPFINDEKILKNGTLGVCFDEHEEDRTNIDGEKYYHQYQKNTLNYFQENQAKILAIFAQTALEYYPKFHQWYEDSEDLLRMESIKDLQKHLYLHHLYLHPSYLEDFSYYGLMAHCSWDDDGFGVVMYKDEVLNVGDYIDGKYSVMEIMKHNGMTDTLEKFGKIEKKKQPKIQHQAEKKWWKFWE